MLHDTAASIEGASRSSLSKALSLLVVVAERSQKGVSLSSAAARTGLHVATAHRLLGALVDENFLNFDPYTKRYFLGLMPYELVNRAGSDLEFLHLRKTLRPFLDAAQRTLGGLVNLSVPSRGEALCIDVIEGRAAILVSTLKIGARRPLGVGAASLALLATHPADARAAVIAREAERYLKYGRLSADLVAEACARLPVDGYVVNEALIIPDIGALALPVFRDGAVVCAVSVTNTISHLHRDARAGIAAVLRRAVTDAGFHVEAA
jgi:DNA-binding IclR family transcriptional regulator